MGPPLGDTALRDSLLEMRERQLRWLQLLANMPGLVGSVHRTAAWRSGQYEEPSAALLAALRSMGWSIVRNLPCLRAQEWPCVAKEYSYPGSIQLTPVDWFPEDGAVYTDGSVCGTGGAAAVCPDTGETMQVTIPSPRSSTHCELVALCLALRMSPSHILTDSLTSLQLARSWGSRPATHALGCADRVEVRQLLHLACSLTHAPKLEKVKAHDAKQIALGHPKSMGNVLADQAARVAATEVGLTEWVPALGLYGDPVLLLDRAGQWISDVKASLTRGWWFNSQLRLAKRSFLDQLYPEGLSFEWVLSCGIFRRPGSGVGDFVHLAPVATLKWMARIRTGCLATRARLFGHRLLSSPACVCCGAEVEDDLHVLTGCPATGTSDWLQLV